MGITPIALADASGPRTIADLTRVEQFSGIMDVREETVQRALDALVPCDVQRALILQRMREYYNGFLFFGGRATLYHPRLCTFFFKELLASPSFFEALASRETGVETLLGLMDCPDAGVSEYSLSFMLSQPQFRNALLLGGMLELPTVRGVMSLGARREVTMPIGVVQTEASLCQRPLVFHCVVVWHSSRSCATLLVLPWRSGVCPYDLVYRDERAAGGAARAQLDGDCQVFWRATAHAQAMLEERCRGRNGSG